MIVARLLETLLRMTRILLEEKKKSLYQVYKKSLRVETNNICIGFDNV